MFATNIVGKLPAFSHLRVRLAPGIPEWEASIIARPHSNKRGTLAAVAAEGLDLGRTVPQCLPRSAAHDWQTTERGLRNDFPKTIRMVQIQKK